MSRQVCVSGINPIMTAGEQQKRRKVRNGTPVRAWESFSQLEGRKTSIRNQALVLTVYKNNHDFNVIGWIFSTRCRVANTVLDVVAFYILHLNILPKAGQAYAWCNLKRWGNWMWKLSCKQHMESGSQSSDNDEQAQVLGVSRDPP